MTGATGRRLEILTLLQAQPGITAGALARRLGVTERTARRDVGLLRDLGYRIDAHAGRAGGYWLAPGTSSPALMLNEDELLAVALGLRATTGVPHDGTAALTALSKVAAIVPARLRFRLGALSGIAQADAADRPADRPVDAAVLVTLALACRQQEAVRIRRPADDHARTLQPWQLVHAATRWYLVAVERGKDEWRTWALDRIGAVELLGTRLPVPPPPEDAAAFVTRSLARGRRHQLRLLVHAPADLVRRLVPATVAEIVEPKEGKDACELRLATDELPGAARWVVSLGLDIDVIEPDELRDELAALGSLLTERYGSQSLCSDSQARRVGGSSKE